MSERPSVRLLARSFGVRDFRRSKATRIPRYYSPVLYSFGKSERNARERRDVREVGVCVCACVV